MKKKSFLQVWAQVGIPLLLVTVVVLMFGTGLVMSFLVLSGQYRAEYISYEVSALLREGSAEEMDEILEHEIDLQRFHMVAILYDATGKEAARSKIEKQDEAGGNELEIYEEMFSKIEQNGRNWNGMVINDIYSNSYKYERRDMIIDNENYVLQYGAVINPWKESGKKLLRCEGLVLVFMLVLSWLIAGNFYRAYRERLKIEQNLRNTSNAMAHDLKTPLMVISGYAENLRENVHTEKRSDYADAILKNVGEMNHIVEQMLELARTERTDLVLQKESVNLSAMTKEILEGYSEWIDTQNLSVEVLGEAWVRADRERMKRMLKNLIDNAVTYTPKGEQIRIVMKEHSYEITNTGVCIPKNQLREMWKPFIKGDDARSIRQGTGVGLAIVKEILEAHGFRYELSSTDDSVTVRFSSKK